MTDLQGWLVTFGYDLEHYWLWPEWLDGSRQQETERQFAFMCPSILIHRAMHDCIHCKPGYAYHILICSSSG